MTNESFEIALQLKNAINQCHEIYNKLLETVDISLTITAEPSKICIANIQYLDELYNYIDTDELNLILLRFFESEIKRLEQEFTAL